MISILLGSCLTWLTNEFVIAVDWDLSNVFIVLRTVSYFLRGTYCVFYNSTGIASFGFYEVG